MFTYILFISIVAICIYRGDLNSKKKRMRPVIGLSLIFLLLFLRFDVGFDYSPYYELIDRMDITSLEEFSLWEPAHLLFVFLAKYLNFTPLYMMIVAAISLPCTLYAIIKNNEYRQWYIGVMIYLSLWYMHSFSIMRQASAVGIVMLSFPSIREGRLLKFLCYMGGAFLFHYSSVCAIPLYFIYNYINRKRLPLFVVGMVIAMGFIEILRSTRYGVYLDEDLSGGNVMKYVYIIIALMFAVLYRKRKMHYSMENRIIIEQSFYVIIFACCMPFIFGGHIGGRLLEYHIWVCYLSFPRILSAYNLKTRNLYYMFFAMLFIFQIYNSHRNAKFAGKDQYVPYQTIFSADLKNPKFR